MRQSLLSTTCPYQLASHPTSTKMLPYVKSQGVTRWTVKTTSNRKHQHHSHKRTFKDASHAETIKNYQKNRVPRAVTTEHQQRRKKLTPNHAKNTLTILVVPPAAKLPCFEEWSDIPVPQTPRKTWLTQVWYSERWVRPKV